jgi:hypothetical protein
MIFLKIRLYIYIIIMKHKPNRMIEYNYSKIIYFIMYKSHIIEIFEIVTNMEINFFIVMLIK